MCYAENQLKSLWSPFQLLFLFSKCGCWGLFPPISSLSLHGCWKGDKRGNNGHTGLNSANLLHFLSETQRQFCTKVFTLSSVGLCFPWKRFLKGILFSFLPLDLAVTNRWWEEIQGKVWGLSEFYFNQRVLGYFGCSEISFVDFRECRPHWQYQFGTSIWTF